MPLDPALFASALPRARLRKLRWWILGWAVAAGILNYMDRSAVSIAAPALIAQLGLTRAQIGLMGTVFSWSYAVAQLPAGWLVDKLGARKMFVLAIAVWSLATAMMGFGAKLWQFLTFRSLLGLAEAPNGPASSKLTADWFPRSERGQATAIWDSGSKWGPAIAPPILTLLLVNFGWRSIFAVLGVAGLLLAAAFQIWYFAPESHLRISQEELTFIQTQRTTQTLRSAKVPWLSLFRYRQVWGMMAGFFCLIWMWNIFIVFLPLYLHEARGVSLRAIGVYASIPYLGGAIIGIMGGLVMTWYTRRSGCEPLHAKHRVMSVAAICGGILICATPFVPGLPLTIATLTLGLGFLAIAQAAAWSLPGDIVDTSQVASLGAIQNFGGYFGGAFAPFAAGLIADKTGSYTPSFLIGGALVMLSAAAYVGLVRGPLKATSSPTLGVFPA